jgi:hypothetical protein
MPQRGRRPIFPQRAYCLPENRIFQIVGRHCIACCMTSGVNCDITASTLGAKCCSLLLTWAQHVGASDDRNSRDSRRLRSLTLSAAEFGAVIRNDEVVGSIPTSSTNTINKF